MTFLINQLGTGVIPACDESVLLSEGTKFACYFISKSGNQILATSRHEDMLTRWAEQIAKLHQEEVGLPSQYRVPQLSERVSA